MERDLLLGGLPRLPSQQSRTEDLFEGEEPQQAYADDEAQRRNPGRRAAGRRGLACGDLLFDEMVEVIKNGSREDEDNPVLDEADQAIEPRPAPALQDVLDEFQAHQAAASVEQGRPDEVGPHENGAQQLVAPGDGDFQHKTGDDSKGCQQDCGQAGGAHKVFHKGENAAGFIFAAHG